MNIRDLDPFSSSFLDDPYAAFRQLRAEAPVHHVEAKKMWIVTRWADVNAAARDTKTFSSTGGVGFDWNSRPMMPMYDPPDHTRMRRVVAKYFTPAAVKAFESRVDALVDDLVARALEAGTVDVVQDLALPLSLGTIAELLGVPPHVRPRLRRWSQGTVEDLAGGLEPKIARRVDELRREFNVYLRSVIEERRSDLAHAGTAIDVITSLVAASEGERLTSPELIAFCVLLMVAGYETTVNAVANGLLALLEHPAELAALRADPSLVPSAIEEMVRYDSPVLSFFRNTLTDATVGDVVIPKGSKVMLAFASANRDERKFPDPDAFKIGRNAEDHLGYGAGVHYCLGAPLARLQLSTIFRALFSRVDRIERNGPVVRTASVLFRGVRSFPVTLSSTRTFAPRESAPSLAIAEPAAASEPEPVRFHLDVPESVLGDLRHRLTHARWPAEVEFAGWDYGTSVGYLKELVAYWRDRFDWRAVEARINAMPGFQLRVDDVDVFYIHHRAASPSGELPLLVLHGWPGSFWSMTRLGEELAKDRDVVVAALPGFPFSSAPTKRGMGSFSSASLFATLMRRLGYARYGVVGEDLGAGIASRMGLTHGDVVAGIHLNMPHENPPRDDMKGLTPEERAWLGTMRWKRGHELTHMDVHDRQPQSLGFGLDDSPVGLAGWIVDKLRNWSDSGGNVETRFTKDDIVTLLMLYWVTNTGASAVRYYFESKQLPWFLASGERIEVPTAITLTKHELVQPPRRWIERVYRLERLTHLPAGGHYGAWEETAAMAREVRAFFADFR